MGLAEVSASPRPGLVAAPEGRAGSWSLHRPTPTASQRDLFMFGVV
ncbi:hypothetical protein CGMCC3_g13383 [Colletotrichum fructicola]|nr:uncharacterized protein CGMCC3_g13383 [Colletotrichum fructicola]KAE9570563.1 hypothetical protein CGMCC3_g13383 [Colletotrichum fructicola]